MSATQARNCVLKEVEMENLDFRNIRIIDGDQRGGFEEFLCQLARRDQDVPPNSRFFRLRGDGGDGGVESYWETSSGEKWGYQSKFFFKLSKSQLNKSVSQALKVHPELVKYVVGIPFDFTGPTGREGQSEIEKWQDLVAEWEKLAKSQGMSVEFSLWSRSDLLDHLLRMDNSNEQTRFWFGSTNCFDTNWFRQQVNTSIAAAGPRYSPELTIEVPVAKAFEAFGRTSSWSEAFSNQARQFEQAATRWQRTFGRTTARSSDETPLSENTETLRAELAEFVDTFLAWFADREHESCEVDAAELAVNAARLCSELEESCLADMRAKHGENWVDSAGWRQFMAEYQCCFPAQYLDAAREFLPTVRTLQKWLTSPILQLPKAKDMLVVGGAGTGKTHAFCDAARHRLDRGLPSVLLLGEQFTSGEPWDQIRRLLGLSADWSRESILSALDASGAASDTISVIFIDALNETTPRSGWTTHLPSMIEAVKGFPNVKLCVACRSTYLETTLPKALDIIQIEHCGFEGIEEDADYHRRGTVQLLKFNDWRKDDQPTEAIEVSKQGYTREQSHSYIVVCDTDKGSNVWVAHTQMPVRIYRDQGQGLQLLKDFYRVEGAQRCLGFDRIQVDSLTETVYVQDAHDVVWKIEDWKNPSFVKIPLQTVSIAIDARQRRIYARTLRDGSSSNSVGKVARFHLDQTAYPPANFGDTGTNCVTEKMHYEWCFEGNSDKGIAVATNGNLAVVGKSQDGLRVFAGSETKVPWQGTKIADLPNNAGGVRFDLAGNLYVGYVDKKPTNALPGFENDRYMGAIGRIHKYAPTGTLKSGNLFPTPPTAPSRTYDVFYGAFETRSVTRSPRFGVDGYGRIYYPTNIAPRVSVMDNAGNEILHFGTYGNRDSMGGLPGDKVPTNDIPLAFPNSVDATDNYIYIADMVNLRLLRLKKRFAAIASSGALK
jgi:hypothetical protein